MTGGRVTYAGVGTGYPDLCYAPPDDAVYQHFKRFPFMLSWRKRSSRRFYIHSRNETPRSAGVFRCGAAIIFAGKAISRERLSEKVRISRSSVFVVSRL